MQTFNNLGFLMELLVRELEKSVHLIREEFFFLYHLKSRANGFVVTRFRHVEMKG